MLAEISEVHLSTVPQLISDSSRDADATWFTQCLQTTGDINSIAEYLVIFDHDVAHVDPDAHFQAELPPGRSTFERKRARWIATAE